MPIVRIDIQAGKSTAYKRALLHGVREGIKSALEVHDDRIMQRIVETPVDDIDTTAAKSDRLTIVEVSMLPGRTAGLKQKLYEAIAAHLAHEPGVNESDLIVIVNDPPAECFYLNGAIQCATPPAPVSEGNRP